VTLAAAVAVNSFIFGNNVLNPPDRTAAPSRLFASTSPYSKCEDRTAAVRVLRPVVLVLACLVVAS